MTTTIPTTEPAAIRAGDTATWQLDLAEYPASTWPTLTYVLINAAGKISFTSAALGNSHLVHVLPAITANWPAGEYQWQARISNGTDAFTIRTGSLTIQADFAALTAADKRSHAAKTLAAIESWIESHDLAVAEYEIAGRRMKYIPITELLKLRDRYRREVRAASGQSGRVYLRF